MKDKIFQRLIPIIIVVFVLFLSYGCKDDDKNKEPEIPVIGNNYKGGIVAYILQTGDPGYDANTLHGFVVTSTDLGSLIQWSLGVYTETGATATAIGTGNANTIAIVANKGAGNYAAKLCSDYVSGGYSDWYLPSSEELYKIYINRIAIGITGDPEYWSSTEISTNGAWAIYFGNGSLLPTYKDFPDHVRAIRAF